MSTEFGTRVPDHQRDAFIGAKQTKADTVRNELERVIDGSNSELKGGMARGDGKRRIYSH